MNRLIAVIAVLALAPAARAEEAQPQQPQQPGEAQPTAAAQDPSTDAATIQGKVEAAEATLAEVKTDVDKSKKLKLSGYVQGRWATLDAGLPETAPPNAYNTTPDTAIPQNGFFIRRGRFKAVYDADWSQYVVQADIVPSGVSIKEGYATIKLVKGWALDVGLQLFPFGYEVYSRSSSDLDLLERALVTRQFLGGEYDLGVAVKGKAGPVNLKVGVFNGNGIDAKQNGLDNDQRKDVIGRATIDLGMVTAGVSGWYGKTINYARDDDRAYDRFRAGADVQVFLDLVPFGGTALKGEYIWGRTTIGSANGGAGGNLPATTSDAPVPTGSGWYALVTQNVGRFNQLAFRYESYDKNHTLDLTGPTNTSVKVQNEIQAAVHTFVGEGLKFSVAWFHPMNGEKGDAAPSDLNADQFIVQAQAKF